MSDTDQTPAVPAQAGAPAMEAVPSREPLLEVDNVTLRFGGVVALDNVNFTLYKGEILGLIGPNGAGKTTCFNAMTGIYQPTMGEIRFRGEQDQREEAPRDHPDWAWPGRSRTSACSRR